MAVLSAKETTALATPGTAWRLEVIVNGQAAQFIFCTASVAVFLPAKAADKIKRPTLKNAALRNSVMWRSPSWLEDERCEEVECQRAGNKDCRENEASFDDPVRQWAGAHFAIRACRFP